MNWITKVEDQVSRKVIKIDSKIVSTGSCFADAIGNRLKDHGFETSVNPFGVLFNPISLAHVLSNNYTWDKKDFVERDGKYVTLNAHSSLHADSKEELEKLLNETSQRLRADLLKADFLMITLGTAWVYTKNGEVVANCQKQPGKSFEKSLLSIEEMFRSLSGIFKTLHTLNKKVSIILTVSPVRHIKDGLMGNSRSKSRLIELANVLQEEHDFVEYFPAYEIVMDELRDYRFYADDLIHPTNKAVSYIFNRFSVNYFSDIALAYYGLNEKLNLLNKHKPLISSEGIDEKRKELMRKIVDLRASEAQSASE